MVVQPKEMLPAKPDVPISINFNICFYMHSTGTHHRFLSKGIALVTGVVLVCSYFKSTAINSNHRAKTQIHFSKAANGKINVQVITEQSKKVALYLFSANGELIKKLDTNTKWVNQVSGINDGQYLYQCFENDTQLKSGKLIVEPNDISYD